MPTRGRADLADRAVKCFMLQDYPEKRLLILDDGDHPSFPKPVDDLPCVSYLRTDERLNIPAKRNLLCRLAAGEIICHFDSDDWSAPDRISDQVARLEEGARAVTGYFSMVFKDEETAQFYLYVGSWTTPLGTSLAYRRSWWKQHPFNESLIIGEDSEFARIAINYRSQFIATHAEDRMCARLHPDNTNRRDPRIYAPIERPSFADCV